MNRLCLALRHKRWRRPFRLRSGRVAWGGPDVMRLRWGEVRCGPEMPEWALDGHKPLHPASLEQWLRPPTGDPDSDEIENTSGGFVPQRWGETKNSRRRIGRPARGHPQLDHRRGPYEAPFSGPGHGPREGRDSRV